MMRSAVNRTRQRGAALIMALVLLGLLLVLGISGVVVSNVQVKVAGNLQFQNLALSTAESGLAQAESWLTQITGTLPNYDNNGFYASGTAGIYPSGTTIDP